MCGWVFVCRTAAPDPKYTKVFLRHAKCYSCSKHDTLHLYRCQADFDAETPSPDRGPALMWPCCRPGFHRLSRTNGAIPSGMGDKQMTPELKARAINVALKAIMAQMARMTGGLP
jgi:hypothetical protein